MTLENSQIKIDSLKHLIGQNVPKWNSPILEMIAAPNNDTFSRFMEIFEKNGNIGQGLSAFKSMEFEILLIFRTPKLHGELVYEWYSFFY